jgi:hypothetical protein
MLFPKDYTGSARTFPTVDRFEREEEEDLTESLDDT